MSSTLTEILQAALPGTCAAAVAVIAVDGSVVASAAAGELVRYADAEGLLLDERPAARRDSLFDLASVSKLFTTAAVLSLVQEGLLDLDAPVATWLPGYDPRITLRLLLTHRAGLQSTRRVDEEFPGSGPEVVEARMRAMLSTPVTSAVGRDYLYTDVGMVTVGRIAEIAGGAPLNVLVHQRVTAPLGLNDTGYRPTGTEPPSGAGPLAGPERVSTIPCQRDRSGRLHHLRHPRLTGSNPGTERDHRQAGARQAASRSVPENPETH